MSNLNIFEENFIIYLTIEGTSYVNVEVKVADPNKAIRDQIDSIVQVFELPKMDNGGNPIQYLLGQMIEDGDEPDILEFEDEDGREQALIDYDIQPGDHLHLTSEIVLGFPERIIGEMMIINKSLSIKWVIQREMWKMGYFHYFNFPRRDIHPCFSYYEKCKNLYVNPYERYIYAVFLVPEICHDVNKEVISYKYDSLMYKDQLNGIYKTLEEYENNTPQYKLLAQAVGILPNAKISYVEKFLSKFDIRTNI